MKDFYQKSYKAYHEQTFNIDPSSFLDPLVKNLPEGKFILDVGCGSGRDLCWLKQRGFKVMGFERSKGLAKLTRKNANCRVIEGEFEVYNFSDLPMDAIILVGSLVHIPHEKFQPIFKNITSGLSIGKKVLITLKRGKGTFTDDQKRIFYLWLDQDLRVVFEKLGFKILDFKQQLSKVRADDIWLGYVLEKISDI